ncbi:hypothetical protein HYC85_023434 [Camellia sinensis]|uniref:Uncharacterized protein n=1 Tax=Camellia sinensis TaxID=4442 RepID=A0A7J7GFT3_CAMSI|nr:hypothetical protein HYC85_023434 [Camellia sinensis]
MVFVCRGLNPMTQIGQLGGRNHVPLISRVMMRQTTILQCWFLAIGLIARRWKRAEILTSQVPSRTSQISMLVRHILSSVKFLFNFKFLVCSTYHVL